MFHVCREDVYDISRKVIRLHGDIIIHSVHRSKDRLSIHVRKMS